MKENKLWKNGLIILLGIQGLFAAYFVFLASSDFPGMLGQFGVKYQPDMAILQFIIVYNAFISLCICAWSILWIRKNMLAGVEVATTLGVLLFVLSVAIFIRFDRVDILFIDTIRAVVMVVFGVFAYREHKKLSN